MEYPSNFETPAFPAGKRIAVSRFMSIGIMVSFLLVLFLCGLIFWSVRSKSIDPFIVSIDDFTGQWTVVGHSHGGAPIKYMPMRAVQEAVVGNFTINWFTISSDTNANDALWQACNRQEECSNQSNASYSNKECALFCASGENIFNYFTLNMIPDYEQRVQNGERWVVDKASISIEPMAQFSELGGTWKVILTIQSNISGDINVVAFAKVARDTLNYPQTFGYYINDFNAYKIN